MAYFPRIRFRKNSAGATFTSQRVNLIEGSGIGITLTEDTVDREADITIMNTGAGGTTSYATILKFTVD